MIQRLRVPLGFLIAAAVFYLATPTQLSIAVGLPIALVGAIFRSLAAGVIRKDSRLAISGPYAWTRNPLYFGSSMLAIGFAVMSWNIIAACLLVIPSALIYPSIIRSEEAHLEGLFGEDFRRYRQRVPVFLPRICPPGPFFSFSQYLANREYNTALGFAGALALLLLKVTR